MKNNLSVQDIIGAMDFAKEEYERKNGHENRFLKNQSYFKKFYEFKKEELEKIVETVGGDVDVLDVLGVTGEEIFVITKLRKLKFWYVVTDTALYSNYFRGKKIQFNEMSEVARGRLDSYIKITYKNGTAEEFEIIGDDRRKVIMIFLRTLLTL